MISSVSIISKVRCHARQIRNISFSSVLRNKNISIDLETTYSLHKISEGPSKRVELPASKLRQMYLDMVQMRRMESAADQLYKQKLIRGFCHLNTGQEAVSVGIENAITREDAVITAYRCHGFVMMRGASVQSILAELMGRRTGVTKGKGGSMHMFAPNFYGGNGIVGAQVPLGAGMAFAQKYRDEKAITVALYGDGAANQGQVFEAYNMAALWKLPCVFACENNKYGMGTSAGRAAKSVDYYTRGDYVPGVRIDGLNVLAVYAATKWAREYAIDNGPLVLEYDTYRYGGHSMSDPGTTYRTREEITGIRSTRDTIASFRALLIEVEAATECELVQLEVQAKETVDSAVKAAHSGSEPDEKELYTDIYVAGTESSPVRGIEPQQITRFY